MKDREIEEAEAFDVQIRERVDNGHIPDLRRSGRCEYFYNNVWRDQEFAKLYFGEVVAKVIDAAQKYLTKKGKIPKKILEVGCGPGHISLELARNHFDVVGLDLSGACIEVAKEVAAEDPWANERGGLAYLKADFLQHNGKYDIVLFTASLHHFPDCRVAVEHAKNLLNPDGIIIVDEPARDLVSEKNTAVILLIKGLLSSVGAYYQDIKITLTAEEAHSLMKRIYHEERYETEDGTRLQSALDNESGFEQMYSALAKCFYQLEFWKDYAFFHQLVGGIRLKNIEEEHNLAKFLKIMDSILCRYGAIDPTNFYFVGRRA